MKSYWDSTEVRASGLPGVYLIANDSGIVANWGQLERTFNPAQARTLAAQLAHAADEAEKRGAKEWLAP